MASDDNNSRKRYAYNLDEDGLPIYVGEGLGAMTYEEVIDLSIITRTSRGLPADKDFIIAHIPIPRRMREGSSKTRASKNNPYICPHCPYNSTRYGNMIQHLKTIHSDYSTNPRTR